MSAFDYNINFIPEAKDAVRSFRRSVGQSVDLHLQFNLVAEEAQELFEAANTLSATITDENMEAFLKEVGDYIYVLIGFLEQAEYAGEEQTSKVIASCDPTDVHTALTLVNVATHFLSDAHRVFLDDEITEELFWRVHRSNMSKMDETGRAMFSNDGKVLKGPYYQPPYLGDIAACCTIRLLEAFENKLMDGLEDISDEGAWFQSIQTHLRWSLCMGCFSSPFWR